MSKILKPYTIIPPDLYVHRDADRQLKNIIKDMGRPGYVLVSRQMGKTNLLFNAKRELESQDDVFVYLDLSNHFDNARSCFENIINTAIEINAERFKEVSFLINEKRKEIKDLPPHKQHTNELRMLLSAIKGKLVIILDEIDALTKTNYSDQIFSQIRSIYFSRVNFKEFEKLTYILSGVIEPTEIIKDSKISPFNIGQQIFLNDFSKEEFEKFIKNSRLDINDEIKERIYYWTSGNPRMTWDVCSEVENKLKYDTLSVEDIDKIVSAIYFKAFDKPPIDNIREIVRKDKEIRNAIIEIEYNKGGEIPDKTKRKLYLTGIINYYENEVKIKNEIIRKSLSLNWIKAVEEEEKGLINIAMELYSKTNYSEALATFERYLKENDYPDNQDRPHYYFIMGHCAFNLSNFTKAIKYFNNANYDKDDEAIWYYKTLNSKGLTYYYLEKYDESLQSFKIVIDNAKKDENYARALLNYGSISIKSGKKEHKETAIEIFNNIITGDGFEKGKIKEDFLDELKSIAYYNLAQIQKDESERINSINNFYNAISLSKDISKPVMILGLLKNITEEAERYKYLESLVGLIITNKIEPKLKDPEYPINFDYDEFKDIIILSYIEFKDSLFEKIKAKIDLLGEKKLSNHLYDLATHAINVNGNWEDAEKILLSIYKNRENSDYELDDRTNYSTLKLLALLTDVTTNLNFSSEYLMLFEKVRYEKIDNIDMEIFANTIWILTKRKKYHEANRLVGIIESVKKEVPEEHLINYIAIYHLEMQILAMLSNRKDAIQKAQQILVLANDEKIKKQKSNLLGDTGLEIIKQNAENFIRPEQIGIEKKPIRVGKSYGRNDLVKVKYKDGSIITVKFKRVETEIQKGGCEIID